MARSLFALACLCLVAAVPVRAELIHQYTFNDGTADDSVGTANGTLYNGATISDGQLQLGPGIGAGTGANAQYMEMPADVIPSGSTAVTIEEWFTSDGTGQWGRGFDFGDGTGNNFFFTPDSGDNDSRVRITENGSTNETGPTGGPDLNDGAQHMIAAVVDQPDNTISYYIDGSLEGTTQLSPNTLTGLIAADNYVGRSQYGDPGFIGSVNQLSIYDTALTASQVEADYLQGPLADDISPAPEPSTLVGAGLACVVGIAYAWRRNRAACP